MRLDQTDDAGPQCFTAEVFLGDSSIDVGRVQVSVYNSPPSLDARLRVRTFSNVNEPVVSVVLRSRCGQNASRRYDFLTEFPVEMRSAPVPTVIPAAAAPAPAPFVPPPAVATPPVASAAADAPGVQDVPPPAPRPPVARAPRPAAAATSAQAPVRRPPAPSKPKPAVVANAPAPVPAPPKAEPSSGKPRLQLDVAPTPDDRQVVLKPSIEMLSAPSEDSPQRADAAAAWRALNLLPAENPEEKKRLMTLEAEAKALKAQLAKRDEEFQARLDRLENSRYSSSVVYGLLGLLLAALAVAAYWWDRVRKSSASVADWSRHSASDLAESELHAGRISSVDLPLPVDEDEFAEPAKPPAPTPVAKPVMAVELPEVVEHPPGFKDSVFDDLQALSAVTAPKNVSAAGAAAMAMTPSSVPSSRLRQALPGQPRNVVVDGFADVRQHAEFFVSLGQYDQAIDLLKKTIDESIELNPLAYLELLGLYQKQGHEEAYERLRDDFNHVFNGRVPPMASFLDEGHRLQEHPSAMFKIQNTWGTPEGLETLEAMLFRVPGNSGTPQFDLAAYRDLLMLYAAAKSAGAERPLESPMTLLAKDVSGKSARRPAALPVEPVPPSITAAGLAAAVSAGNSPEPASAVGQNSHTQPMLLMSEMAKIDDTAAPPKPAGGQNNEPLDIDLDLNLDFTNSELQVMANREKPADLDLDLPLLEDVPVTLPPRDASAGDVTGFPAAPPVDSNLIEFDLFDPNIEAKISPKTPKQ
ncbi:hypothetical protein [Variovorax sp. HJSM1_2]|uniref:tetratricopeptide repeat protein n=1 Tax=Variovorax sp. HJSM1_2 TaxID=3366263 RepID=UPI003BEAE2B9